MKMGIIVKDRITGFQGVVTACTQYITGFNLALVQPPTKVDGEYMAGQWFEETRLEVIDAKPVFQKVAPGPGPTCRPKVAGAGGRRGRGSRPRCLEPRPRCLPSAQLRVLCGEMAVAPLAGARGS
ncbi:MAG: hypothetical protein IPJ41_17820 [Phycisphaerales bacterium]|nr:hypothetical protein [Phycisphaerales bacterium]